MSLIKIPIGYTNNRIWTHTVNVALESELSVQRLEVQSQAAVERDFADDHYSTAVKVQSCFTTELYLRMCVYIGLTPN